nr:hypothetical protein [Candidatus Njordarchaeota archaeon]
MVFLAWEVHLGPFYVNLTTVFLGLLVLALAVLEKLRVRKRTPFLEVSLLLLLLGFIFLTLHGELLQLVFPIALPERPMLDNNLTFNYTLTGLLVYLVFPVLLLILLRSDISLRKLGLRVPNRRQTMYYGFIGLFFSVFVFLVTYMLFGYKWVSGYTFDGIVLWAVLVTILSLFIQTLFYIGMLFNKYLNHEYVLPLAVISLMAPLTFSNWPLPWFMSNVVSISARVVVTWKTHNIYAAALMNIVPSLLDILTQFT